MEDSQFLEIEVQKLLKAKIPSSFFKWRKKKHLENIVSHLTLLKSRYSLIAEYNFPSVESVFKPVYLEKLKELKRYCLLYGEQTLAEDIEKEILEVNTEINKKKKSLLGE